MISFIEGPHIYRISTKAIIGWSLDHEVNSLLDLRQACSRAYLYIYTPHSDSWLTTY